jgi:CheY-like chemotaxis protein
MATTDHVSENPEDQVKTILVVDDDTGVREFIVDALKLEGSYRPLLATDAAQALALVNSVIPDLFVLDYQLPGIDGLELADRFQATEGLKHIPIVLVSANMPKQELEKRHIVSLEKPFELDELLRTVKALIAE